MSKEREDKEMTNNERPIESMENIKKYYQLSKKCRAEVEDIYYDGEWTIILKNHDRVLSEDYWYEVKWQLEEMVRRDNFELYW